MNTGECSVWLGVTIECMTKFDCEKWSIVSNTWRLEDNVLPNVAELQTRVLVHRFLFQFRYCKGFLNFSSHAMLLPFSNVSNIGRTLSSSLHVFETILHLPQSNLVIHSTVTPDQIEHSLYSYQNSHLSTRARVSVQSISASQSCLYRCMLLSSYSCYQPEEAPSFQGRNVVKSYWAAGER